MCVCACVYVCAYVHVCERARVRLHVCACVAKGTFSPKLHIEDRPPRHVAARILSLAEGRKELFGEENAKAI